MIVNKSHLYAVPFRSLVHMILGELLRERTASTGIEHMITPKGWSKKRVTDALGAGELPRMDGPTVLTLRGEDITGMSANRATLLVEKALVSAFEDIESNRLVARILPPLPECKIRRIRRRLRCNGTFLKDSQG